LLARDEMSNKDHTMSITLQGKRIRARTFGLTISIIDFTLSRINTGAYIDFLVRIHCAYFLRAIFDCSAIYLLIWIRIPRTTLCLFSLCNF
uniref:Uncharacterized protein n=1 Tax=Aegilops tauschii subsp. strangulata TaxID=200361 RepID=A0A453AZ49_AEGTS